ncbi:MAG: hypothetical protein ACK55Z_07920, partial [bacterium]
IKLSQCQTDITNAEFPPRKKMCMKPSKKSTKDYSRRRFAKSFPTCWPMTPTIAPSCMPMVQVPNLR